MTPTGSHAPACRPPALAPAPEVSPRHGTQTARHEPAQVSRLDLATLPSAPFWARRQTEASLTAWQLPPETIETATLLVSELVTNAARASGPPASDPRHAERISLTLRLRNGWLVIEVSDNNPNPPVLTYADTDAESGRGLMLVQALSTEWGHRYPPAGGKIIFAVIGAETQPLPDPRS